MAKKKKKGIASLFVYASDYGKYPTKQQKKQRVEKFVLTGVCKLQDIHEEHIPRHQKHIMKKEEKAKRQ